MDEKAQNQQRHRHQARKTPSSIYPATPPEFPKTIDVIYLPGQDEVFDSANAPFKKRIVTSQILYKPGILAIARVSFQRTRWEVHSEREVIRVIPFPSQPLVGDWDHTLLTAWDNRRYRNTPQGICFYVWDRNFDFSEDRMETLQEEFINYLITHEVLEIEYNPSLKIDRKPEESEESFTERCLEFATENLQQEMKILEETLQRLQNRLKEKMEREVREIGAERLEMRTTKQLGEGKRHRPSDPQEEMEVRESIATIDDIRKELEKIEVLRVEKKKELEENILRISRERQKDLIRINRGNVQVLRFSVLWLPYVEIVIQEDTHRRIEIV